MKRRIYRRWEREDWLCILNWKPRREDEELAVHLPSIEGAVLNDSPVKVTPEHAKCLQAYVHAWIEVKRQAWRLLDPKVPLIPRSLLPAKEVEKIERQFYSMRPSMGFSADDRLLPGWLDDKRDSPDFDPAVAFFIRIMAAEDGWRLAGRCAQCNKYFLRERRRKDDPKYCPTCRTYEARNRMEAKRGKQHREALGVVRQFIKEWKTSNRVRRGDWKPWVVRRTNQVIRRNRMKVKPITAKALTRWQNAGELRAPAMAKTHRRGGN